MIDVLLLPTLALSFKGQLAYARHQLCGSLYVDWLVPREVLL